MEDTDSSPSDDIDSSFKISETLIPSQIHKEATLTGTSLDGLLSPPLRLKEDLKEGCGGQLWPAGMVLAKYMQRKHRTDLKGKTIVELGAGGGLVGLAVAQGCQIDPRAMVITDQVPMLSLMRENILLNGLSSKVEAAVLDWGEHIPEFIPSLPDIILAADCVYFEPAFPLLLSTLEVLIGPETVCYFCFKKRRRADMRFMKQAKRIFEVTEMEDDPDREIYSREQIFLYSFRKRR